MKNYFIALFAFLFPGKILTQKDICVYCSYSSLQYAIIFYLSKVVLQHNLHRSTSNLCESSFTKMKSRMVKLMSDEPPYEKNGRGIPITGSKPIVIPTFTIK